MASTPEEVRWTNGVLEGDKKTPTTTISTIAVQSGNTRIVIALLQSKEWIQLKIQEMHPAMTDIGNNLEEALELHRQHEKVLEKLQTKQSPVEELLRQADELISTQKPRGEVYSAMAENLGLAWKDLNAQLEQRRQILEQAVAFFSKANEFSEVLDKLQKNLIDPFLPDTVDVCRTFLQKHQEDRKAALSSSMNMLNEGQHLLEKLCEVGTHSMGDSRPVHMQHAARQTSSFVERYMETLHDRWRQLEVLWNQKKSKLEQCLKKCEFMVDLSKVQNWLQTKASDYAQQSSLGDSLATSEILQHEHSKIEKESMEVRDHCLKLVKTAEKLVDSGHYAAEELKTAAYDVLMECSDFLSALETRHMLLSSSVSFFNLAQTALNKLDQIEIQLTTSDIPHSISTLSSHPTHLASTTEEVVNPAIKEGHSLLDSAGRQNPGAQGVARKVSELESRKKQILDLCNTHEAENAERTLAFKNFCDKYTVFLTWISNNGQAFVQRNRSMGTTQTTAKHFVDQHESVLNDIRLKGMEVEALLSTVPSLIRMGGEDAQNIHEKAENLRELWTKLKTMLEKRILLGQRYFNFHKLAKRLSSEMDEIENLMKKNADDSSPGVVRTIEEKLLSSQQELLQLNNSGRNFIEDANKMEDPYLNTEQATTTVAEILAGFQSRKTALFTQLTNWQNQISTTKETMIQWEHLMKDSHRVIKVASELEGKMFPVIPRDLNRVESIISFLDNRMVSLLPQIKSVQQEMDTFLKKSETLSPQKDPQHEGHKMIEALRKMNQGFQKKLTDYQILISMMTTYFKNFDELEKLIDMQESQFRVTSVPTDVSRVEVMIHEHDANKPTVLELFKFTNTEAEQVIKKINESEPPEAAAQDKEKIMTVIEQRRKAFEKAWEDYKKKLERHLQLCIFNRDMQMINHQIEDLNSQLSAIRKNYGESLSKSLATSEAFIQFEKTIEILEIRIRQFISTAERAMTEQKIEPTHVHREIENMQNKWSTFRTQVSNNRHLIDLEIEYFKIIEESEEWLKEGSKVLISIARKSSNCKNASEANALKEEVQYFINKGKSEQQERMKKISTLALQLYGNPSHPTVQQVATKNKDMVESFTVISNELYTLTENIKLAEKAKMKEEKEKEEMDIVLQAAQAEAEAAKAAAEAAREAAKAAEAAAAKAVPVEKQIIIVPEAVPIVSQPKEEPPAVLSIQPKAPVFVVPLVDAEVPEGTKFVFECTVEGFPEPLVQWFKDGILADNNPDYQTQYINGVCTLSIEETFSEDTAKFTCRATNSAGTAETHCHLTVKESRSPDGLIPPHFIKELADAAVVEGMPHSFECQVSGNPLPLISWFKNDQCIDNSTDFLIMYNNGFCTLHVEDAAIDYSGRYTCRAANPAGQVACSANLQVLSSVPSERPSFVVPLCNVMARAGQKLRLECTVNGKPTPEVSWLHNGKTIKETRDIKPHFDGNKATLIITEAFPKDAGVYTIIAKNKAGEAVSQCNVSVKGRLPLETSDSEMASDIEPAKPQVKHHLQDITTTEGKKVRMDCVIVGQPEPEVIWYHDGKPVKESDDFQLLFEGDRCTLIIKVAYLEDAGTYKCVAINSGGEASSQCALTVQPVSEAEDKNVFSQKDIILIAENVNPPKFIKPLRDLTVTEGQQTVFECQVSNEPGITVRWLKDGSELKESDVCKMSYDSDGRATLTLFGTKESSQGTYTALAENKGGIAQSLCSLKVLKLTVPAATQTQIQESPPSFLRYIEDNRIPLGSSARFESIIVGTPKPQVKWTFQGEPVKMEKGYQISETGDYHSLFIPKASKDHVGRYCVVAENNAGISTSSASLAIEEPLKQVDTWDSSVHEQKAQSMIMKKKTTLVQKSTIRSMSDTDETLQLPVTSIHIAAPLQQEWKPSQDVRTSDQRTVSQITTVQMLSVPPRFVKPVSTAVVKEGEKLLLEGIIEGTPVPEVKWYKEGTELHSTPRMIISFSGNKVALFIPNSLESDSGKYSCVITNTSGKATSMAEVRVKPPREAPKFAKHLQAGVIKSGARLEMVVEVTGIPTPEVKWYRNNAILQSSPDLRILSDKNRHSIIIAEAFPDDSGLYMVSATNAAGEARSIADLIVEEDRSPEEDKIINYQEVSSVEQKKEFFTKISVSKTTDIEPYQQQPVKKTLPPETTVSAAPQSPPPIPAVTSKVWTKEKPEFPAPEVVGIVTAEPEPVEVFIKKELEEEPLQKPEKTDLPVALPTSQIVQDKVSSVESTVTTMLTGTTVHTSVTSTDLFPRSEVKSSVERIKEKFSTPDAEPFRPKHLELTKIQTFEPLSSIQSIQSVKQSSMHVETSSFKSETSVSFPRQEPLPFPKKFEPKPITHISTSSDEPLIIPQVWKPGQVKEKEAVKPVWKPVQPVTATDNVPISATVSLSESVSTAPVITKTVKLFSETPTSQPGSLQKTEFSHAQSEVFSMEEKSVTQKYESQQQTHMVTKKITTSTVPKPIIKKEGVSDKAADGAKPKKEVVIEEEPVVGAEVRPPVFSKVRGADSLKKIV